MFGDVSNLLSRMVSAAYSVVELYSTLLLVHAECDEPAVLAMAGIIGNRDTAR